MEAMWTRFFPAVVKAREAMASGAIGAVKSAMADFGLQPLFVSEEKRCQKFQKGQRKTCHSLLVFGVFFVVACFCFFFFSWWGHLLINFLWSWCAELFHSLARCASCTGFLAPSPDVVPRLYEKVDIEKSAWLLEGVETEIGT